MLKLHCFDRSPYGWKSRIVLAEKKVPYEMVIPQNKSEDAAFAKLNPFRLTPVLELADGRTVYESTIVNEYLDEVFPDPPMMPKDPWERARVRMLEDTTDQYFMPAIRALTIAQYEYQPPHLIRKKAADVDPATVEHARARVHEHLARLEAELEGRDFFGGSFFSLADAALVAPLVMTLPLLRELPDRRCLRIAAWTKRVVERPSYEASRPKEPPSIKQ